MTQHLNYCYKIEGGWYPSDTEYPERDATDLRWEPNTSFPGTMQAVPDIQETNTRTETNGPALVYLIDFQTKGIYYVYIKGFGIDKDGDSIHFGLDGLSATRTLSSSFSFLSDPPIPKWMSKSDSDVRVAVEVFNPGIHTFYIWMRENGVNVQRIWLDTGIDKVSNGDTIPGPPDSDCY